MEQNSAVDEQQAHAVHQQHQNHMPHQAYLNKNGTMHLYQQILPHEQQTSHDAHVQQVNKPTHTQRNSHHHSEQQQPLHHHHQTQPNQSHQQRHQQQQQFHLPGNQHSSIQHNHVRVNTSNTGANNRNSGMQVNTPFQAHRYQNKHNPHRAQIVPTANMHPNPHLSGPGLMRPGIQDGDIPLRILVQGDMVGAIIGRSGGTIKQITQHSKARIDVHREESLDQNEKIVTINGTPESCSAACYRISEIIMNEKLHLSQINNSESLDNNLSSARSDNSESPPGEVQLKILAHNNLIGRLIGRNGASIKNIMELTSTRITITTSSMPDERIISVTAADLEHLRQAEQSISTKLRAAHLSDMSTTLQTMNQQPLFNNVPIPYMAGPYGQGLLPGLVNSPAGQGSHPIVRPGMPLNFHRGHVTGSSLYTGSSNYLPYPNMPPGVGPSLLGFNPSIPSLDSEREIVHIYIPNSMVGAIIGKSGIAIKEMISQSGAIIKVESIPRVPDESAKMNEPECQQLPQDEEKSQGEPKQRRDHVDESPRQEIKPETDSDPNQREAINSNEIVNNNEDRSDNAAACGTKPEGQDANNVCSSTTAQSANRYDGSENQSNSFRKVTVVGFPDSQWSAQYFIYRKVSMESGKSDISLMVEIRVPSQLVGKIIGKGGATVKQIQKQTRTTIRLPDDKLRSNESEQGAAETSCLQITGLFHNSQLAQRQIRNLIREGLHSAARIKTNLGKINNNNAESSDQNSCNTVDKDSAPRENNDVNDSSYDNNNFDGEARKVSESLGDDGDKQHLDENASSPQDYRLSECPIQDQEVDPAQ